MTFVGFIIWYRWAFFFADGIHCDCLGLLGKLLHLTKTQEKVIPVVTLIFLTATTLPWWLRIARPAFQKAFACLSLVLVLGILPSSNAGEVIQVRGEMSAARYNPVFGTPFTNTQARIAFSVTVSKTTWMICATNLNDSVYWAQVFYDGTNLFTLCPKDYNFWLDERPTNEVVFATISPSPLYVAPVADTLGIACIYVTYILSPNSMHKDKRGIVQMPLPWQVGRMTPRAYGYKWLIHSSNDRFIEDFEVVRDHALDLPIKEEVTRWELDYPATVGDRNWYKEVIEYRKEVPDGYVEARFNCTEWVQANELSIPQKSDLVYYLFGGTPKQPYNKPHYQAHLKALSVNFVDAGPVFPQASVAATQIHDYRFKKATSVRIYKYADYTLEAGENWKVNNDPTLVAQAEKYLKSGPRIGNFADRKTVVAWCFGVLVVAPLGIMLLYKKKTKKHTT